MGNKMRLTRVTLWFGVIILNALSSISARPNTDFLHITFPDDDSDHDIFDFSSRLKEKLDRLHEHGNDFSQKLHDDWNTQSFFDDDDDNDDDFFENVKTLGIVIFCAFSLICISVLACCCLCPICCLYKRRRGRVLSQGTATNQTQMQSNYNQQQAYSGQSPYPVQNSSQGAPQQGYPSQPMPGAQPLYPIQPQGPGYSKPQEPYNPSYHVNSNVIPPNDGYLTNG